MTGIRLASGEFNQVARGARKAAKGGPVFIIDRLRPAPVSLRPRRTKSSLQTTQHRQVAGRVPW